MKKRIVSVLLVATMVATTLVGCGNNGNTASSVASSAAKTELDKTQGKYPIEFDVTQLYKDEAAWQAEYDRIDKTIDGFSKYKGTLNTAKGIYDYFTDAEFGDVVSSINKMDVYSTLRMDKNGKDAEAKNLQAKISVLIEKYYKVTAFADAEIYSMSMEQRKKIFNDPILAPYKYALKEYTDEKTVHHSEETTVAMSILNGTYGGAQSTFQTLIYTDQVYPEVTMPDGSKRIANDELYSEVIHGDYDEATKEMVSNAHNTAHKANINTYAALLNTNVKEKLAEAKTNGFSTVLEYQLHKNDIDPQIYTNIKAAAREMLPAYHKLLAEMKKRTKSGKLHFYDTLISISQYSQTYSYDEACEEMKKALSILGEDYVKTVSQMVETGHIDVYAAEGKKTGAYMMPTYDKNILPYILTNFTGDFKSLSTLCHEMGHAVYQYNSENSEKNNISNDDPTVFTQEVASITNEMLLSMQSYKTAQSDEEKAFYLDNVIITNVGSVIRQMLYSEFEEYIYSVVENGGALNAEDLNNKWMELNKIYYGEDVIFPEGFEYRWAVIPHFYYGYYVFKYATSSAYATTIAQRICDGKEGAVSSYKEFLTRGSSASPAELLKVAGVDPLDKTTYNDFVKAFEGMINERIKLK